MNSSDEIQTRFVPITRVQDIRANALIIMKLRDGSRDTLTAVCDDDELRDLFDPLFKLLCPDLTAVGSWADLCPPAKLKVLDELFSDTASLRAIGNFQFKPKDLKKPGQKKKASLR